LAACVVNYGAMPTDPQEVSKDSGAVLGNYGGEDRGIPVKDVRAFEEP